jgi:hypothetical protein
LETHTFKTPLVPKRIEEIRHPLYKNIYDYSLGNRNLWGTEILLGDWDGRHLLIAKDFYPTCYVAEGLRAGVANPYRHKQGIPTNSNLLKTLRHFRRIDASFQNTECGFLYISACFLLRDDGRIRERLPNEREA